jgi:hypothetical protein
MNNSFLTEQNNLPLQIFINNMEKYDYSLFNQNNCLYLKSCDEKNKFNDILNIINNKYNNNDVSSDFIELLKDDMNIKVFVLKNCIMRICEKQIYNKYYSEVYKTLIKWNHKNLETIYEIYNTNYYVIIVSKKIMPIFNNYYDHKKTNFDIDDTLLAKLQNQIFDLIQFLADNGAIHNDLCLDNIGFDSETNNFVAYDFDKFKIKLNDETNDEINDMTTDKILNNTLNMITYFNKSYNFRFGDA